MWGRTADRQAPLWQAVFAVLAGGALLLGPALYNGYPLVFSDTHAFLIQGTEPRMVWDKPFAYGPLLRVLHNHISLWLPAAAQALLLSHLLWLVRSAFAPPTLARHLLVCAVLTGLSAAPWFASLLMPDIFAPITVLCLFLLGFGDRADRTTRIWAGGLGTLAIGVHLSHLVIAVACLLGIAMLRPSRLRFAVLPLLAAMAILVGTNLAGFGRFAVSPYGSVFLLARLAGDGVVDKVLAKECPNPGWRLCAWAGRLPTDSDLFLWEGQGPVWSNPGGAKALAREAGEINTAALRDFPAETATAMLHNTTRQLTLVALGDTLGADWLEGSVTNSLREYFPPQELDHFHAGRQSQGTLAADAAVLNLPDAVALGIGLVLVICMLPGPAMPLAVLVLLGLLANAFATGALSKPHDRYQARIAWLLVAVPLLAPIRRMET